ncbi:hypothetical protein VNO78_14739 [Psophocarpus tetragonolobus]|uniref:Uncharacterized protein n=1 Tax=Psophocarpus tetragonolobus TaxID=3891 RepID=A0AAN9SIE3_PSOTE
MVLMQFFYYPDYVFKGLFAKCNSFIDQVLCDQVLCSCLISSLNVFLISLLLNDVLHFFFLCQVHFLF